jgi:hypothetical protein
MAERLTIGRLAVELFADTSALASGLTAGKRAVESFGGDVRTAGTRAADALDPVAEAARSAAAGLDAASASAANLADSSTAAAVAAGRVSDEMGDLSSDAKTAAKGTSDLADEQKNLADEASDATEEMGAQLAALAGLGAAFAGLVSAASSAIEASANLQSAFLGLRSVSAAFRVDADAAEQAARTLASDGLMTAAEAAQAFKLALSAGYSLEEATQLLSGLKEQAVFNRQAHYSLGEAVVATTEGIKNENSVLADATGTTKNLSVMYKEYAAALDKGVQSLTINEKRQAALDGFLKETAHSTGDLAAAQNTLQGSMARSATASNTLLASVGDALAPAYQGLSSIVTETAGVITSITEGAPALTAGIAAMALAYTGLATAAAAATLAQKAFQAASGPVGWVVAGVSAAVGALVAGYSALADEAEASAKAEAERAKIMADQSLDGFRQRVELAEQEMELQKDKTREFLRGMSEEDKARVAAAKSLEVLGNFDALQLEYENRAAKKRMDNAREALAAAEKRFAAADHEQALQTALGAAAEKVADMRAEEVLESQKLREERDAIISQISDAVASEEDLAAATQTVTDVTEEYNRRIAAAEAKEAEERKRRSDAAKKAYQELVDAAREAAEAIDGITDRSAASIMDLGRGIAVEAGMLSKAQSQYFATLDEIEAAYSEAVEKARKVGGKAGAELEAQATKRALAATREAEDLKRLQERQVQLANARAAAAQTDTLLATIEDYNRSRLSDEEKTDAIIQSLYVEMASAIVADTKMTAQERADIEAYYAQRIADEQKKLTDKRIAEEERYAEKVKQTATSILSQFQQVTSALGDASKEQATETAALLDADAAAREKMRKGETLSAEEQAALLTSTERENLSARLESQKEFMVAAFNANKLAAITQATINGYVAATKALAELGPVFGPPAALAIGALSAIQVGLIAAQEPPEFHEGGMVTDRDRRRAPGPDQGEVNATLKVGEGVLTAAGIRRLGGASVLAALNSGGIGPATFARTRVSPLEAEPAVGPPALATGRAGRTGTGAEKQIKVVTQVDGRTFDQVIVRGLDNGRTPQFSRRLRRLSGARAGLEVG